MSLIHADNMSIYNAVVANMTASGRYAAISAAALVNDPDGVSAGKVLVFNGNGGYRRPMAAPTNKVGIAQRVWLSALPSDNTMRPTIMLWADATNQNMARLMVNTTGSLTFSIFDTTSGAFGTWFDIVTTAGPAITAGVWWHVESKFDSTSGFECRVEGVPKIISNLADWGGHLHNGPNVYQCRLDSAANVIGASINTNIKDVAWWDGLGTENTDFLGGVLVAELDPDSDVSLGYWTPSTGLTGYNILSQVALVATTPNMTGINPPGAAMQFTLSDLPADVSSVKGIITLVRAAKQDGGDGNLQVSMVSDGSTTDGVNRPITAAQSYWEDIFELDPATAAPWLPTAVDLAQIKISRTV